jgi:hypothetical protein
MIITTGFESGQESGEGQCTAERIGDFRL